MRTPENTQAYVHTIEAEQNIIDANAAPSASPRAPRGARQLQTALSNRQVIGKGIPRFARECDVPCGSTINHNEMEFAWVLSVKMCTTPMLTTNP